MPRMPPPRRLLPSALAALLLVSGCLSTREGDDVDGEAEATESAQDFVFYLGRVGYPLHPAVLSLPTSLGVAGQAYEVGPGEGFLVVYEFPDEATARRGLDAIQLGALGGVHTMLFHRGPLVVVYTGGRSGLTLTLTNTLGPAVF